MKSRFFPTLAVLASVLIFAGSAWSAPCAHSGSIIEVKKWRGGSFEYVNFTVKKPLQSGFSWAVTSPAGPTFTQDPSGNTITVTGPKYKEIVFRSVFWTCTIPFVSNPTTRIKAVKNIGQFEGVVDYVVGYVDPTLTGSKYLGTTAFNCGARRCVRMKFLH
jgi:hypothetical protein